MVYLITYATSNFKISSFFLRITAWMFGVNKVIVYRPKDIIDSIFYKNYKHILDQKRGAGYWLWKAFIINKTLNEIKDNDILIYSDAAVVIRKSLKNILRWVQKDSKGIVLFNSPWKARQWVKRDIFIKMDSDEEKYYDSAQACASIQFYRKTKESLCFSSEFLNACCIDDIITDAPSTTGLELREFMENRHDQAILSLVAHKNDIVLYPEPSQFINAYELNSIEKGFFKSSDFYLDYKNTFFIHRFRNADFFNPNKYLKLFF